MVESKTETLNILILNSSPSKPLVDTLKSHSFKVNFTDDIDKALIDLPEFVIFPAESDISSIVRAIKKIIKIHHVPLIYLGLPPSEIRDEIDDYVFPSSNYDYLVFKILSLSRRIKMERDVNPLTGLPGNKLINLQLEHAHREDTKFIAYIDINDFKPYNDTYGFNKGDEVIRFLGNVLYETVIESTSGAFLGHIGGDDFIIIGEDGEIENISKELIRRFEDRRDRFYNARDIARSSIVSMDRDGRRRNFPLLSLCVVSFSISEKNFRNINDISQRSVYLKKWLKAQSPPQGHSIYFKEDKDIATIKNLEDMAFSSELPEDTRRCIIEALGELGDANSLPILEKLSNTCESIKIRKSALYAMGRLKEPKAVSPLIEMLSDPSPHIRTRAVEALGEIGHNDAYDPITKLASDKNNFVRQKVMLSLGKLGNRDSYNFLINALKDPDPEVVKNAIWAAGEIKNPAAIPHLKPCLEHPEPAYRSLVIEALGKIPHPESAMLIYDSLLDKSPYVQWQGISRLPLFIEKGFLKKQHNFILEKLLEISDTKNDFLKRACIIAIGCLKDRRALTVLLNALLSKNDLIRWAAVISLGKIADREAIPSLVKMFQDKDDFVRTASVWALGEIADSDSMEVLRQALKDKSSRVRESAASSIVRIALKNNRSL